MDSVGTFLRPAQLGETCHRVIVLWLQGEQLYAVAVEKPIRGIVVPKAATLRGLINVEA